MAGRFDSRDFRIVFDGKGEDVAIPIEVVAPYLGRDRADAFPRTDPEFRLIPRLNGETRETEIDAGHLFGCSQPPHAGESAPRALQPASIPVDDPDVGDALQLETECGRKARLPAADDQHIESWGIVAVMRDRPLARGIGQICEVASHPFREPGNAHVPRLPITRLRTGASAVAAKHWSSKAESATVEK